MVFIKFISLIRSLVSEIKIYVFFKSICCCIWFFVDYFWFFRWSKFIRYLEVLGINRIGEGKLKWWGNKEIDIWIKWGYWLFNRGVFVFGFYLAVNETIAFSLFF